MKGEKWSDLLSFQRIFVKKRAVISIPRLLEHLANFGDGQADSRFLTSEECRI